MKDSEVTAWSPTTNTTYPTFDDLIEAEANGYVAVAVISNRKQTWPYVEGPYPTKREASNARNRMRTRLKRELHPDLWSLFVRPAWKSEAELKAGGSVGGR